MRHISIIFICSLLVGCKVQPKTNPLEAFDRELNVSWEIDAGFPLDSLGNPDFLQVSGGHLIFAEPHGEQLLMVYNPDSGTVTRMLPRGKAENECLNVHQIGPYPIYGTSSFYVYDNYQKKIFIYSLQREAFVLERIQPAIEGIKTFSFLTPEQILGCASDSSRYLRADTSGRVDCRFGDYKEFDLSVPIGSGLLQGLSLSAPGPNETQRYAWFSFYGAGYQIIESGPDNCRIVAQAMYKLPQFEMQSSNGANYPIFGQKTVVGYIALTTDGQYIYTLYGGHALSEILQNRDLAWRSRHIGVYDWDGNPLLLLKADHDLKTLAYDNIHDRLYALSLNADGDYALLFLDMDTVRQQAGL